MENNTLHSNLKLILASSSPRRQELLRLAGFTFEVRRPDIMEVRAEHENPKAYTLRLAEEKAMHIHQSLKGAAEYLVLAADTIGVLDDEVLEKPTDKNDAFLMLKKMSGRTHEVLTAFCLFGAAAKSPLKQIVTTRVTFRPLTDEEIHSYIATGEPMDKAGSYAAQGVGATLIARVEGSYTNVIGLPIAEVIAAMRTL